MTIQEILRKINVSYAYSFKSIDENKYLVSFSKPTKLQPIPVICVYMECEFVSDSVLRIQFETKKGYKELHFTRDDLELQFNEAWIDAIYSLKEITRKRLAPLKV